MTTRRQILIVPEWYPSPGDPVAGVFIRDQVRAAAQRCEVAVLAPAGPHASSEYADDGVRIMRLPPARGTRRMIALSRLSAVNATVARLGAESRAPDVIHAHFFSAGFAAVLVGRRRHLPVVVSEHLSDVEQEQVTGWDAMIARYTYRHADLVCPVSSRLERSLLRLEPRANSEVVENVVDIDFFAGAARERPTARGKRLLTVARLAYKKGLPDLLAALRYLVADRPEVTLEIVGDGPDRSLLESLAAGLPVTFVGAQSRDGVAARMKDSDVLVIPSHVETFGITAIEGLAAGLRVVVTSVVPTADVVAEFGGIVTPPADPMRLSDALRAALDEPQYPHPGMIDTLRERYGPDAAAARWESIYRVLSGKRSG